MADPTMNQIRTAVSNASFVPSAMDLLLAAPRLAQRAGSFALFTVPERIDNFFGKLRSEGMFIPEATMAELLNASGTITSPETLGKASSSPQASANATSATVPATASHPFTFDGLRNIGGMFTYMTSKWALAVFAIVSPTIYSRHGLELTTSNRQSHLIVPNSTLRHEIPFIFDGLPVSYCTLYPYSYSSIKSTMCCRQ